MKEETASGNTFSGKTVEEAISKGLEQYGLGRDDVEIRIIDEGKRGLFGKLLKRPAQVTVIPKTNDAPSAHDHEHKTNANVDKGVHQAKSEISAAQEAEAAITEAIETIPDPGPGTPASMKSEPSTAGEEQSAGLQGAKQAGIQWQGSRLFIPPTLFDHTVVIVPTKHMALLRDEVPLEQKTELREQDTVRAEMDMQNMAENIIVDVSKDGLEASISLPEAATYTYEPHLTQVVETMRITFVERQHTKQAMTSRQVIERLFQEDVTYGMDYAAIQRWVEGNEEWTKPFVVAKGKAPKDGTAMQINVLFETKSDTKPDVEEDQQTVDWFAAHDVGSVEPGERLLQVTPATKGEDGRSVHDQPIPAKPGKELKLQLGNGVAWDDQERYVLASIEGRPKFARNRLDVVNEYTVNGDLTLEEGSIKFNGDVRVRGDVQEGLKIEAGGDVHIGGRIINATVHAAKSVEVRKNIIGSNVRAGGDSAVYQQMHTKVEQVSKHLHDMRTFYDQLMNTPNNPFARGGAVQVGRVLQLIVEKKFPKFTDRLISFKKDVQSFEVAVPSLDEWLQQLVAAFQTIGPINIQAITELDALYERGCMLVRDIASMLDSNASVHAYYIHNSNVFASGDVTVQGLGAYMSHIVAGGVVEIGGKQGIVRGGNIEAQTAMKAKTLGGQADVKTYIHVKAAEGDIIADHIYPGVELRIANGHYHVKQETKRARFVYSTDAENVHQVLR